MLVDLHTNDKTLPRETGIGCRCGSGLRGGICCDLDLRRHSLTGEEGAYAGPLTDLARLLRIEDWEGAHAELAAILEDAPGQRDALGALFNLLRQEGRTEAATAIVQRLTMLHPNDMVACMAAIQFFLEHGEIARAHWQGRMLVRLGPEAPISHFMMGRIFLAQSNAVAAEHHFSKGLSLLSELPADAPELLRDMEAYLGLTLRKMGRFEEARALFRRLEQAADLGMEVLLLWAGLEESDRNLEFAGELLARAWLRAPNDPRITAMKAGLLRRRKQHEEALVEVAALEAGEQGGHGALLEKGYTLDAMGRYDEAFDAFDAFKRQLRERTDTVYRADTARALVDALSGFFTKGRSRLLPRAEVRAGHPQPIFIIGFPRSGTTLVEQSLTSHPNIAAGDELPIIDMLADRSRDILHSPLSYPRSLSELWLGDRAALIDTMRDLYLNEAASHGAVDPAKPWFTDKMPLNETHLGLIHLLFPKSPVIHLVRHPLDVVLSVFSNWLTHGFHCANSLETAASHYALIADLTAHYLDAMPVHYHAVRYEDLVVEQEREVRGLLDFIGEPFDPRTLEFHNNARPARTASYAQVTEKLYDRSRYRYRNYLKHLEPVIPILQPAIERLGYTIEGPG